MLVVGAPRGAESHQGGMASGSILVGILDPEIDVERRDGLVVQKEVHAPNEYVLYSVVVEDLQNIVNLLDSCSSYHRIVFARPFVR